jgi:hypothetical protein
MTAGTSSITSAELLKQLESKDTGMILKALKKLEKIADINDLHSILKAMAKVSDLKLLNEFTGFLSNIRSNKAPVIMVQFLADPSSAKIRAELTRACWESQLDYSPHLMLFADLFIGGDYMLALEAFTVIENTCLERPVSKSVLTGISILMKNSLPDQPETKQRLTRQLILVLEPFVTEG